APTLVMLGDADVIEPAHAERMAELLPRAQLEILRGCAHGAYLGVAEVPPADDASRARVLARIEAFLDGD
ncbi:MAG TPA: alpha/beta hydrolase, partial [Polyangia bacterium]